MYWNYLIQTSQSCDISPLSERSLVLFLKSCCRYHALNKPENTHLLRKRKYHWMADLLFDWLGFSCFAYVELMFYKHGPIPTSQTGGQPLSVFSEKTRTISLQSFSTVGKARTATSTPLASSTRRGSCSPASVKKDLPETESLVDKKQVNCNCSSNCNCIYW